MISGVSNSSWQIQMQNMQVQAKDKMDNADVNGDNTIDMDEFLTVHEDNEKSSELFSKIDSDGDGGLTQDELKSFGDEMRDNMHKMMSEAMGRMASMRGVGGPGGQDGPGGAGKPGGKSPGGGGIGQESIDISALQEMLTAYASEDEDSEITVDELFSELVEALEESDESETKSLTASGLGRPAGPPPPSGEGRGQESFNISTLQELLTEYESDEDVTVEELLDDYLAVLEAAEEDQTMNSTEATTVL